MGGEWDATNVPRRRGLRAHPGQRRPPRARCHDLAAKATEKVGIVHAGAFAGQRPAGAGGPRGAGAVPSEHGGARGGWPGRSGAPVTATRSPVLRPPRSPSAGSWLTLRGLGRGLRRRLCCRCTARTRPRTRCWRSPRWRRCSARARTRSTSRWCGRRSPRSPRPAGSRWSGPARPCSSTGRTTPPARRRSPSRWPRRSPSPGSSGWSGCSATRTPSALLEALEPVLDEIVRHREHLAPGDAGRRAGRGGRRDLRREPGDAARRRSTTPSTPPSAWPRPRAAPAPGWW